MPDGADAYFVVGFDSVVQLGGLPVPDVQLAICIARHHVTHIRREVHLTGVSSHHVTLKDLLLVEPESVLSAKDKDLIIHGLTSQPLPVRGQCHRRH